MLSLQADTLSQAYAAASTDSAAAKPARKAVPSVAEVIARLPEDATPAQQDSAVQAAIPVENTHLSTRPDTLSLPGIKEWTRPGEVTAPEHYVKTYLGRDTTLFPGVEWGRDGVAGDPVPYSIRGDDVLTALLIFCFIAALTAYKGTRRFFAVQAKAFFRGKDTDGDGMSETSAELRSQAFFMLQTCLLLALVSFIYATETVAGTFVLSSQYQLVAVFFGVYVAYFAVKMLVYWLVNNVFFGRRRSAKWLKVLMFAVSAEGVALFPLVLLMSYFDLSVQNAVAYVTFVTVIVKISLFYKSFILFFRQKVFFLQIILYFCALEIMPLLSLLGVLVQIVEQLKINF